MLRDTYDRLCKLGEKRDDLEDKEYKFMKNVYSESFLTHASCLYEFFYEDKKYEDDIRIEAFAVNQEFEKNRVPIESFE